MNMDGKRFWAGLAAGLILGLVVVVASSGATFGLYGSFSNSPTFGPAGGPATASTTMTVSASTTMTVTAASTSTASVQLINGGQGNTTHRSWNSTVPSVSSVSTTTTSSQKALNTQGAVPAQPSYSSRIDNMSKQPLLANSVIIVPVLAAFLIGTLFYRASKRNKDEPSESPA